MDSFLFSVNAFPLLANPFVLMLSMKSRIPGHAQQWFADTLLGLKASLFDLRLAPAGGYAANC